MAKVTVDIDDPLDPRIAQAEAEERAARERRMVVVAQVQAECPQVLVGEAPYEASGISRSYFPSFRVCLRCGLREDKGTYQQRLMAKRVFQITRDEGYALSRRSDL